MAYDVKEAPCWPVNELGEIVVQTGRGSSNTVGYISSSQVAIDPDTKKVVMAGVAQLAQDANNNTVGIVGATSTINLASLQSAQVGGPLLTKQFQNPLSVNPTDVLSNWDDLAGAGVTASLDTSVLFDGKPSIRLDIPASFSGTARIGTSAATCRFPYLYAKKNFAFAIKSSNLTAVSGCNPFIGDATLANYFSIPSQTSPNQPQMQYANNDWMVYKPADTEWANTGGTPVFASLMRLRINFTVTSVATATQVWIGFVGIIPKRPKPTIIFSPDDGFSSWYDFLVPLLKHHRIPASFACTSSLVGSGGNKWSLSQLLSIANDPTGLFEVVNHNRVHQNVGQYATAQDCYNDVALCREYMRSIGLPDRSNNHHAYPNSVWRDDLTALLIAGGFKTARASTAGTNGEVQDQLINGGDKLRWKLNVIANLQAGTTLANVITAVTTLKNQGGVGFINAHDFAQTEAAYVCSFDVANQVVGYLASERDAGNIELMRWSDWYETYCVK
jgi:hypothetical protein